MKKILDYYTVKDAPQDEIEQFLQTLPLQNKAPRAWDQMKLQWKCIPKYYILLLFILTAFTIYYLFHRTPEQYNREGIWEITMYYLIGFLVITIPQFLRSGEFQMEELERSCRYSYIQILFTRIRMFACLFIAMLFIICTAAVFYMQEGYLELILTISFSLVFVCDEILLFLQKARHWTGPGLMSGCFVLTFGTMRILSEIIFHLSWSVLLLFIIVCAIAGIYLWKQFRRECQYNETFSRACYEKI